MTLTERFRALVQEQHKMWDEDREVGTLATGFGVQYLSAALNETIRELKVRQGLPVHDETIRLPWQQASQAKGSGKSIAGRNHVP